MPVALQDRKRFTPDSFICEQCRIDTSRSQRMHAELVQDAADAAPLCISSHREFSMEIPEHLQAVDGKSLSCSETALQLPEAGLDAVLSPGLLPLDSLPSMNIRSQSPMLDGCLSPGEMAVDLIRQRSTSSPTFDLGPGTSTALYRKSLALFQDSEGSESDQEITENQIEGTEHAPIARRPSLNGRKPSLTAGLSEIASEVLLVSSTNPAASSEIGQNIREQNYMPPPTNGENTEERLDNTGPE